MNELLRWLEATPLSIWTRESTSVLAFPAILSAHAIGMALAAGVSGAVALRLLGAAQTIPAGRLQSFVPVLWIGFWLNASSGVLLLIAYPTKALTNPVFYLKLGCIALAMTTFVAIRRRLDVQALASDAVATGSLRWLAIVSLAAWVGAIFAGRLLAYTYHRLLVDF
ncbi:MAG: hypothetical protein ABMA15_10640 [Vicinamibacterales bacterium]